MNFAAGISAILPTSVAPNISYFKSEGMVETSAVIVFIVSERIVGTPSSSPRLSDMTFAAGTF